ncbi:MAG: UDP-3-O-[3-hydroxymyristoyl] N-acetylglucosamine deacetylase [Nitrospinae bacterium]|nr:UDP-3-O-[3-hydroxymyristoyl] N-acetylglucosamine deacetylase [Nitrospinota bacterium]
MHSEKILVVDDEINILNSLRGILSDEGYSVRTAQNGDDALKMLQEQQSDLVLLDIWLPGRRDGLQTLREIRRLYSSTEVVMISGHASIDTAVRATKMGAFHFLEKPLSLSGMLETVTAALNHSAEKKKKGDSESLVYITGCPAMDRVKVRLQMAASGSEPMLIVEPALITGGPGSGKEYSARYLHSVSDRRNDTFIKVACRRLTNTAFYGLFGAADEDPKSDDSSFAKLTGTIFLENPNLLEPALQDRLAELISVKGENKAFVAAVTVAPGEQAPKMSHALEKCFPGGPITLPPLCERGAGVNEMIDNFVTSAGWDFGKTGIRLSPKAMEKMTTYSWPGNVKELNSVVENAVMACPTLQISEDEVNLGAGNSVPAEPVLGGASTAAPSARGGFTQKTIGKSVVLCGLGLHSGLKTGIILAPLPANSGIIFGDISSGRQVKAHVDFVESTEYATKLQQGTVSFRTIEHLMAVLNAYGITNALIKVGEEVPIMDGSAVQLCDMIEKAGVVEQAGAVEPIVLKEQILIGDINKKYILAEPCDRLVVEYRLDYPQPVGKQTAVFDGAEGVASFKSGVAPARTFGFVEHIKKFEGKGFAEGGKLSNFILIDGERVINTTLRFDNEFSRHKTLDLMGDIYLLGRPLNAKITANMTGHTENILLARRIVADYVR